MAAALLRSGKFLRVVSGLARQPTAPVSNATSVGGGGFEGSSLPNGPESSHNSLHSWSMCHLYSTLPPVLAVATVSADDDPDDVKKMDPCLGINFVISKQPLHHSSADSAVVTGGGDSVETKSTDANLSDNFAAENVSNEEQTKTKDTAAVDQPEIATFKSANEMDNPLTAPPPNSTPSVASVPLMVPGEGHSTQWYPLNVVCQMFRLQGRYWDLEVLLEGSRDIREEDRKSIYYWTLQTYMDAGLYDRARCLTSQLYLEGLSDDFPEYHCLMSEFSVASASCTPGFGMPLMPPFNPSPSRAFSVDSSSSSRRRRRPPGKKNNPQGGKTKAVDDLVRQFKRLLVQHKVEECLSVYDKLQHEGGNVLTLTELSSFIELLVKENNLLSATRITTSMLSNEIYPLPKIFRFLLNRLAATGDVTSMSSLGHHLTPKVKKEVSFDNRLCNAYLAAGRGEEFLDLLEKELTEAMTDSADDRLQTLKDKFPRGGAMGLLESNPLLVSRYTNLAHRFLNLGYAAPINVLWTYHFVGGRYELATPLWENHVKQCPQIMFQKVCQTARSTGNADLAQRLVNILGDAPTVTVGARGIAYSCLLDVLVHHKEFKRGLQVLQSGLVANVVGLNDVNRTALKRLKEGYEMAIGEKFPLDIPSKSVLYKDIC